MDLPVLAFENKVMLRSWLESNHAASQGIYVRVFKKSAEIPTVSFQELLEEGLCFGWSESLRLPYDEQSYLQKFTPRRTRGTTSVRNKRLANTLVNEGRMTQAGLDALGMD